jgi:hypothetical protein
MTESTAESAWLVMRRTLAPQRASVRPWLAMKGWVGWTLLGLSLVVALAGYRNQRVELETEELSRTVVCQLGEPCTVNGERPHEIRTDVLRRRYEWGTSLGAVTVTCRRRFAFAGPWECVPVRGEMVE